MYRIEYQPLARQDILSIIDYISVDLDNLSAARQLAVELLNAVESARQYPYAMPILQSSKLTYKYRKILVRNYVVLYRIDEINKLIIIARVFYAKRDYLRFLE